MDWIKKYNLMSGVSEDLKGLENTLKSIDDVLTIIDGINSAISIIVNTISTISSIPAVDPNVIALQEIQKTINKWVDDFLSEGVYCLPVFPSEVTGGINGIKGGFNNFKQKVIDSFYDVYDNQRPTFNFDNYIAAIIYVYDTSSISDIMTTVDNLLKMFNIFTRNYKIEPIKTASLGEIQVAVADNKVQFQWFPDPKGLQPDSYVISRGLKSAPESGSHELATIYPLLYPILFEDPDVLINDTIYVYTIWPYFLGALQEVVSFEATPIHTLFPIAKINTSCSNLNCESKFISGNQSEITYSCKLNNPAFDKKGNKKGGYFFVDGKEVFIVPLCSGGKNVCTDYTNKQCKYDNGTRCTSPDYTNSKSRSYDKSGNTIPVSNTSLYFHPYCIDGTNAQVCDGYVENKLYFNGTPPNWQALSAKQFLPVQLSPILDQTTSFINFMVSTTQKADTAINIFGNELSTAASSLKSSLSDIRDMIVSVNEIFTTPLPFMYQLEIPTQYGGIDSLISQLNAAQNGPKPNKDSYTVGFALVFGAKEQDAVDAAYNLFKSIF